MPTRLDLAIVQSDPQTRLARRSIDFVDHVAGDLRERNGIVVDHPHCVPRAGFGSHRLVGPLPHRLVQGLPDRSIHPRPHELAEPVYVTG